MEYPFVFFPVGLNLRGRRCVVVGVPGEREANEKEEALREVGADVVRILDPQALRDRFLLCAIDQPKYGFVAMQAVAKAGPVRIAISTGGIAPRVGGILKAALQQTLDATFVRFIDCLCVQRERNRVTLPHADERRAAMLRAADGFEVEVSVRYPAWYEAERAAQRPLVR